MARKKMRDRFALTPEEQRRAAMVFTRASVHAAVKDAAVRDNTLDVAKPDDPSISDLTQALIARRRRVQLERGWIESKRLRLRLAAVCRELEEIVPPLRAEATGHGKIPKGPTPAPHWVQLRSRPDLVFRRLLGISICSMRARSPLAKIRSWRTQKRGRHQLISGRPTRDPSRKGSTDV